MYDIRLKINTCSQHQDLNPAHFIIKHLYSFSTGVVFFPPHSKMFSSLKVPTTMDRVLTSFVNHRFFYSSMTLLCALKIEK